MKRVLDSTHQELLDIQTNLPPEIITHIMYFCPNDTFNLSKVSKYLKQLLYRRELKEKLIIQNDSFELMQYILTCKVCKINLFFDFEKITSSNCLNIITNEILNHVKYLSQYTSKGSKIHYFDTLTKCHIPKLLKQYCITNNVSRMDYIRKLLIYGRNRINIKDIFLTCLINKSFNMADYFITYQFRLDENDKMVKYDNTIKKMVDYWKNNIFEYYKNDKTNIDSIFETIKYLVKNDILPIQKFYEYIKNNRDKNDENLQLTQIILDHFEQYLDNNMKKYFGLL